MTENEMNEEEEELEDIQAYDAAMASNDEVVPFEQAIAKIERGRASEEAWTTGKLRYLQRLQRDLATGFHFRTQAQSFHQNHTH